MACQKAHHQLKFHVSLVEGEDPLIASNLVVILEVLKGESLLVPLEVTKHLATCSRPLASFFVCRYAVTQHKRCHNRFLSIYVCWSCSPRSFFFFSSWTLSSPALGAIGVRACRLSRPDRSQEKRDPFLICQRTCRALFDLPDDLFFSLFLYPPLGFPPPPAPPHSSRWRNSIRDRGGNRLNTLNGPRELLVKSASAPCALCCIITPRLM